MQITITRDGIFRAFKSPSIFFRARIRVSTVFVLVVVLVRGRRTRAMRMLAAETDWDERRV